MAKGRELLDGPFPIFSRAYFRNSPGLDHVAFGRPGRSMRHAACWKSPCLCRLQSKGPMIKLKSDTQRRSHGRRVPWLLVLSALVVVGLLVIERWRGQSALTTWKGQMEAKGEKFDPKRLWPPPSPRSMEFSNQ